MSLISNHSFSPDNAAFLPDSRLYFMEIAPQEHFYLFL